MIRINREDSNSRIPRTFSTFTPLLLIFVCCFVDCGGWQLSEDENDSLGQRLPLDSGSSRRRRDDIATNAGSDEFDSKEIIPSNYNIHLSPPTLNGKRQTLNGAPTDVQLQVLIVNVRDIKELTEELTLELNLKMSWKDERLRHLANWAKAHNEQFLVLNVAILDKLWHPDIFVDHVKAITQPSIVSKPASLRIYPDSTVRYSARCTVDMLSYAYNDATLNLTWKGGKGASLVSKLVLPSVDVGLDNPEHFGVVTNSGRYAGLRFAILLRRKLSYHLLQTYLPSTLFIFVSWQSFLVPTDSVPGRIALCVTTLLTLTAMFSSVRQNTPNVSYIKAIDVWMVSCIIFVFLTLLEYTILLKLKSRAQTQAQQIQNLNGKKQKKKKNWKTFHMNRIRSDPSAVMTYDKHSYDSHNSPQHFPVIMSPPSQQIGSARSIIGSDGHEEKLPRTFPPCVPLDLSPSFSATLSKAPSQNSNDIDWVSQIERVISGIIPSLFILFNFVYWPWLLYRANYYKQFNTTVYYSTH